MVDEPRRFRGRAVLAMPSLKDLYLLDEAAAIRAVAACGDG
ncbi:hypothetical protein [Neoroseomonas terrae]|nr:hypothetical protein [Neoroseomonas terrae]